MSVSFLKHYYNFSITFNVILGTISFTGKVHSVGLSYLTYWDIQKLSSLELNESTESTSTTALVLRFVIVENNDKQVSGFSYNYTHNLYTRNKMHNKSIQTKQQYCLWTVLTINKTRRRWQNRRVWRKSSAVQAPDNISAIISHKMFTILKIVHTRPDVSSAQLPAYFNSGKLLNTNSFAHAYQHATATIQPIKLYVRTSRCLDFNWPRGEPHVHTSSRDALPSACK